MTRPTRRAGKSAPGWPRKRPQRDGPCTTSRRRSRRGSTVSRWPPSTSEPGSYAVPQLAHNAITAATKLSSDRVRKRLLPLADELDARRDGDYRELARMARQVATTRA